MGKILGPSFLHMVGSSNSCSLFCSFLLLTCSRVFHPFDRTLSPSSLRHLIYIHSANFPYAILPFALLFSLPVGKCLPEYGVCMLTCVCMHVGSRGRPWMLSPEMMSTSFETSLSLAWNSAIMLDCLVHAPQGPSCFCFPSSGVSCATHHSQQL